MINVKTFLPVIVVAMINIIEENVAFKAFERSHQFWSTSVFYSVLCSFVFCCMCVSLFVELVWI